jgi:hypothetical protein
MMNYLLGYLFYLFLKLIQIKFIFSINVYCVYILYINQLRFNHGCISIIDNDLLYILEFIRSYVTK